MQYFCKTTTINSHMVIEKKDATEAESILQPTLEVVATNPRMPQHILLRSKGQFPADV
jgi:hypothetical protein